MTVNRAPFQPLSLFFFRAAALLGFISIALLSFNAFPYGLESLPYPERPAYLFSLAGMICYALSLRWTALLCRHKALVLLVAAFLLYGFAISLGGALRLDPQGGLTFFSLLSFTLRKALPMLYVLWFAGMLLDMDAKRRRQYFIGALIVMFIPNALHMILENLANAGWDELREWLIEVNSYFRKVNSSHGNWPPPYYADRVRGLFAEPSHLAYALIPMLGYCFYRLRQSLAARLAVILAGISFFCAIPTLSGILVLGLFCLALVWRLLAAYGPPRPARVCALLLLGATLLAGTLALVEKKEQAAQRQNWALTLSRPLALAGAMSDYAFDRSGRERVEELLASGAASSRFFTRLACLRLEAEIARRQPLGCGFYLSAAFWEPLRLWENRSEEIFIYIREAFTRPFPVVPHLCEYSALASELGLPGLALFLLLCLFIGWRAGKACKSGGDDLLFYMLAALAAFMLSLCFLALKSGFMMYYFLGFLYALGERDQAGARQSMREKI